jgi:hypothetical protein
MRQVKLQNKLTKVTRPATNDEVTRLGMKKSQDYKDRPKTMATKPASEVPTKDLPSKLNAAVQKAKQFGRTISSVSKEFDGKEVQGKRIESRGGKKVKEVYSMPGGGKRIEKERYNQAGNIVSRKIKDTKINPR